MDYSNQMAATTNTQIEVDSQSTSRKLQFTRRKGLLMTTKEPSPTLELFEKLEQSLRDEHHLSRSSTLVTEDSDDSSKSREDSDVEMKE